MAEKRIRVNKYLLQMTSFIWLLEKKIDNFEDASNSNVSGKNEPGIEKWAMVVNPESASDIAKIS